MTSEEQAAQTGFDLEAILAPPNNPDAIKVEIIWQQWGNVYDYVTFTPGWTGYATSEILRRIGGRVRTIVHVELTDFGQRRVTPEETYLAMRAAWLAGAREFDVYGSKLADDKNAWPWLLRAFRGEAPQVPDRRRPAQTVLVLEDEDRDASTAPRLATKLLVNLLGHFRVLVETQTVSDYRAGDVHKFDAVIYQGTQWDAPLPPRLLADLDRYTGSVLWVGANLWQLLRVTDSDLGIDQPIPVSVSAMDAVRYRGVEAVVRPRIPILGVRQREMTVEVVAEGSVGQQHAPVVVRKNNFWYVAGYLYVEPETTPLQWIVADLLHDVLRTPHAADRRAVLVVSNVHPQVEPTDLWRLAAFSDRSGVRMVVAVTPTFVDPVLEIQVRLEDRPAVVDGLRALARSGADIVLAGYSHQFRGRTGTDFEFWDALRGQAREDDSVELIRDRLSAGLTALRRVGLFPIAWMTPGGLASPFDYTMFGNTFSLMVESRQYAFAHGRPVQQRFPYLVWQDVHGHTVLSPNVLAREWPQSGHDTFRALRMVRDALAVIDVPSTASDAVLGEIVAAAKREGFAFTSLRQLAPARVVDDTLAIVSTEGTVRLHFEAGQYLRELEVDRAGSVRTRSVRRIRETQRYEVALRTRPDSLLILEVLHFHPMSVRALFLHAEYVLEVNARRWREMDAVGRAGAILGVMLSLLAAVGTMLLLTLYLRIKLRRLRGRDLR
ncbi:MAG: DUF2334 domain-containing protein [Armatimonadota bacterium]|nr:DUF2334 domain-containing protein [Armatimonadota bacterium]